ncbi:MAG: hypothetical protein ACM3SY_13715 [Candidatus Omnitrophota bacterium]
MKKKRVLLHVTAVIFLMITISVLSPSAIAKKTTPLTSPDEKSHPVMATPEKTLEIFLSAFVRKDIKTVMAYVPSEDVKSEREAIKLNALEHMTEKKHVTGISGIQLEKIEDQKTNGKVAYIVSKIEVSQDFFGPGIKITDAQGKTSSIFKWTFRQADPQSPWLYDGGGF